MERLAAGDPDAINDFYRHCARLAMRARQSGLSNEDAEDATQDAFLGLLQKEGPEATSISLFATINRFKQLDILRKNIVRESTLNAGTSVDLDNEITGAAIPDFAVQLVNTIHRINTLARALEQIPKAQADAFIATSLNDQSYKDYAAEVGISPGAARISAYKARAKLRDLLSREDIIP